MNLTDTIKDKQGRVACPASLDNPSGNLLSDWKIHFASPSQIAKYGICRKCRARMKKNGKAILAGKVETPAEMTVHHHTPTLEEDHAGTVSPGVIGQTTDFDFDAVDAALGFAEETTPEARSEAAEAFGLLLNWIWSGGFNSAQKKLIILTAGVRPDLLDNNSYEELAAKAGCTKAALSKAAKVLERKLNFKFARSRSASACAHMAVAAVGHKATNTRKRRASATVPGMVAGGCL